MGTYARRAGVSAQRLAWWQRKLDDWATHAPDRGGELRLVPVVTPVESTPRTSGTSTTARLPGGVELELTLSAESAVWLAAVAMALARAG